MIASCPTCGQPDNCGDCNHTPCWYTGKISDVQPGTSTAHETLAQAEAWIAEREKIDPVGVARGDYYIDGPEQ